MKKNYIFNGTYSTLLETERYIKEHREEYGISESASNETIGNLAQEIVSQCRDDELDNLNKVLDNNLVVIGTATTWNGSRHNVAMIGNNLNLIMNNPYKGCEDIEIYADRHNVIWEGAHHDGRNYALFRKMKDNSKFDSFITALRRAKGNVVAWNRVISRYTRSVRPDVAAIYGWH